MNVPQKVAELVEHFDRNLSHYKCNRPVNYIFLS
jgi:hypothetical protein